MQQLKRLKVLLILPFMVFMFVGTGCHVQKNDFHKKKWKIKKGHPPIQRYYNKWSPLNPHRK